MKVSVVIPAHNEETYLARTLACSCALHYHDREIIVVDNASTDRTAEIAKSFPVTVVQEEKKGLLHARERGRVAAHGQIIANMDADCLPPPDWLEKGLAHFEDSSVVAVSGPCDYYDAPPLQRRLLLISQKYFYPVVHAFLRLFKKSGILIGGNTLLRASSLAEIGGYTTSIAFYGEDSDTAKRISKKGKIIFDRRFVMQTSARRFKAEGTARIIGKYFFHFFKIHLS